WSSPSGGWGPPGVAGVLRGGLVPGGLAPFCRELALHDLHVTEVELQFQVWPPDPLDDAQRLPGVVQEIARNVPRVDRLDNSGQAGGGHAIGGPAQIVDIAALAR